jgi:Ca2+-binding EF-hand superfamily protein
LEILLTNIRSKQKTEGLPIYNPPQEISTPVLHDLWDNLNDTQDVYDKALREHLALMKRLELLLNRFRSRGKKIYDWQTNKTNTYFAEDISKLDTISALQAKIKVHETFDENLAAIDKSLNGAKSIGDEVIANKHESSDEIQQTLQTLEQNQAAVKEKSQEKEQQLQDQLRRLEEVIANCLEFARLSEQVNMFFDDVELATTEPISANNVKDVDNQAEYLDRVDKELSNQMDTVNRLADLTQKIQDAGYSAQIYTDNTYEDVANKYNSAATEIDKRKQDLATERERQLKNADLLSGFAKSSAEYKKWTADNQKQFNQVGSGSPEEQVKQFKEASSSVVVDNDNKYGELTSAIKGLEEAEVVEQSDVTQQELGLLHDNLQRTISKNIENLEQAILAQKSSNLTAEQIKDFQETFKYFDKDKDGKLNKLDFKATCNALGEDVPEQELDRVFTTYDKDKDGSITFEEFLDYMSKIAKEGGGYEDVLEAFKQIANGNQYISEAGLRSTVDKQEVDYLLTKMPKVGDAYDYEAYLKSVYNK